MLALRVKLLCLVGLAVFAGCSSLPAIHPDLARPSKATVRLEGSRGVLTAPQSKAILDQLRSRSPDTNIFDRHLAVEEAIVGSPLTTGNQVQLLQDGPATYRAMFAAIDAAKDHINLETYILDDDEVGQQFVQALMRKLKQGVQVNIIWTVSEPSARRRFFSEP